MSTLVPTLSPPVLEFFNSLLLIRMAVEETFLFPGPSLLPVLIRGSSQSIQCFSAANRLRILNLVQILSRTLRKEKLVTMITRCSSVQGYRFLNFFRYICLESQG